MADAEDPGPREKLVITQNRTRDVRVNVIADEVQSRADGKKN